MKLCLVALYLAASMSAQWINCGGPAVGPFGADQFFSGSTFTYVDQTLGSSEWIDMRYGLSFIYDIPIAVNGIYTIVFELVEPNKTGPNQRIFHIAANGVDSGPLDLFALAGGAKKQYTLFMLVLVGNRTLHIQFSGQGGQNAVVSAITVTPLSVTGPQGPQGIPGPMGPAGPPGPAGGGGSPGQGGVFVPEETLQGALDGSNAVFTVSHVPITFQVYRNGIRLKNGVDYTIADASITFLAGAVPQPGDSVMADYTWSGAQ